MKLLRRTQFGNPILRLPARKLEDSEIVSGGIQRLIADMWYTVEKRAYGVGLAAPQVGHSVAICLVAIKPTPSRPDNPILRQVMINPEIIQTYGRRQQQWEGCISFGSSRDFPYAKVPRYTKIRARWQDETAVVHEADFTGLAAHVIQHECDHLQGVLFVDRVKDSTTFITIGEYKKRYRSS